MKSRRSKLGGGNGGLSGLELYKKWHLLGEIGISFKDVTKKAENWVGGGVLAAGKS